MFPVHLIDAFIGPGLRGNPAAVCPLEAWLPDAELQAAATRIGVSDTAFLLRKKNYYELRWFTPTQEIDLCGHATLAAAHWHFSQQKGKGDSVLFKTKEAGDLTVTRAGTSLTMDFPSRAPSPYPLDVAQGWQGEGRGEGSISAALGARPLEILETPRDYLCVFSTEEEVRALKPNMEMLKTLDRLGVIVTAPSGNPLPPQGGGRGEGSGSSSPDFVSRFFAPRAGIPEDPVTGSAHCVLAPFWASRLGKTRLHSIQVSERGGEIFCKVQGDRVLLTGRCSGLPSSQA